jgi:hypothetical protein
MKVTIVIDVAEVDVRGNARTQQDAVRWLSRVLSQRLQYGLQNGQVRSIRVVESVPTC